MKSLSKSKSVVDMLLLFLIVLIPRVILIWMVGAPLRTPMDEMSTMTAGAYMAGLDWTDVSAFGIHYYGAGMTVLMAPLFRIFQEPMALYRACLIFCAVVQSLVAPIAYRIMKKYLKISERSFLYLASIAAAFLMVNRAMVVYNEHMLVLVGWLIALVFCKLISIVEDTYLKRAGYSVILMLLLSYSLTLHTRAKTLWIALVILVILYYLMYKKWLVAKIPALLSGVAGYWLAGKVIYWSKTTLWHWVEGMELKNTSVKLNLSLDMLLNPVSWQGWFDTVLGQVHTSVIFTGGFSAIAITLLVIYLCKNGKTIFVKQTKTTKIGTEASRSAKPYLLVLSAFFMMCIGATILAQSLTWLFRVVDALTAAPYGGNAYGYKAFTYFRYYGAYMGPFFLVAFGYIYHERESLKKYLPAVFSVFCGIQILFLVAVLPHISNSSVASEVYWPFAFWKWFASEAKMRTYVYLAGVLVSGISFLVMFIALYKKKIKVIMTLLCLLLVYQYGYNALYYDGAQIDRYEITADAGYQLLSGLEEQGQELPEEIYVAGHVSQTQRAVYIYQFQMNRHKIIPEIPDKDVEEAIVLSSKREIPSLLEQNYAVARLDKNEWIYVKGANYQKMFEEYGVAFQGAE